MKMYPLKQHAYLWPIFHSAILPICLGLNGGNQLMFAAGFLITLPFSLFGVLIYWWVLVLSDSTFFSCFCTWLTMLCLSNLYRSIKRRFIERKSLMY
jgi:hypothetical protein